MQRVALVAGEISGDRLAADLIHALRRRRPDLKFVGIAGPAMVEAGCEQWAPSEALAVMGLAEVLVHLPRLRRVFRAVQQRLLAERPALFVGVDAPDFNLRLEASLKQAGIRTVHYVSPSVWAWRPGRVRTIRAACDLVLCLLPFEQEFLRAHGIAAEFVGHPLADQLDIPPDAAQARRSLGLQPGVPTLAVLPGSRRGEVTRLGPVFADTIRWLAGRLPDVQCVAPMATPALGTLFARQLARESVATRVLLTAGGSRAALAAGDAALVASGTATLETMLLYRPMVVAYRLSPPTYLALRMLGLVRVPHIALPNLLAGERLVPEFVQGQARASLLGPAVLELLSSGPARSRQLGRFTELGNLLRRGASDRAADAIVALLASG